MLLGPFMHTCMYFLWWKPHLRTVVNAVSVPEINGEADQLSKDIYCVRDSICFTL